MLRQILTATIAILLALPAFADDLLPPGMPIQDAIDHYIDAKLVEAKVTPAAQAEDSALIRRLTLDLVGRIPTTAETEEFVSSQSPSKRALLVDRLMASSGFIRHQATMFDAMLMEGTKGSIREYLMGAMADNKSWDKIFSDLLMPIETSPTAVAKGKRAGGMTGGSSVFLRERLADLDKLTTEVSIVFFGVNVSCARCHDHPIVPDWKQDHFFGMKSFFARTVDVAGFLGEREAGLVKFQTTKGVSKQAKLMFLTGQVIEAPGMKELTKDEEKKEKELIEQAKKNKTAPPPPKFSARKQLVEVALAPQGREFFAKAIVNRLWQRFHGFGLVNPVDQMHSENPPSHPELMDWLARDTIEHGYDLRRLIRGLAMSKTYSRSSRWDGPGELPMPKLFAVGRVKALTPMQMATSLRIATTDPKQFTAAKPDELEKKMEGVENAARGMASMFEWPGEDFQVSVSEALLFSNGDRIQRELLTDGGDRLLGRMKTAKDRKEMIDIAVRTTLCRAPTADEIKVLEDYLAKRADRPAEAQRQLVWALLNSSEFRFNY